jgi:hypothetical protein
MGERLHIHRIPYCHTTWDNWKWISSVNHQGAHAQAVTAFGTRLEQRIVKFEKLLRDYLGTHAQQLLMTIPRAHLAAS